MDFCRDQPLVLAGIGLAVGAAIGAMLPRTEAEDQFMGDASDELKEQTKEFATVPLVAVSASAEVINRRQYHSACNRRRDL
jgi:hypothetical protein